MTGIEKMEEKLLGRYRDRTPVSREIWLKNRAFVPGGSTRAVGHIDPYPFFGRQGDGCYLTDVDGNRYIDCVNNMTALIHGHAHPAIVKAICDQAALGTCHAAPGEGEHYLAKHLCQRIESVEQVRFCNSGTEATLFALRAARAFTGRDMIVKMDGGYNGSHDWVQMNIAADVDAADLPRTTLNWGVPRSVTEAVRVAPLNDIAAMERIFSQNGGRIAAVIIEPIFGAGGGVVATREYLSELKTLAHRHGALLIFDEVITLRLGEGGYQSVVGVAPDLTAMGKLIGGGLPIGAFGGRQDVMDVFNHSRKRHVVHSGTFSGNALSMEAGYACMMNYRKTEIDRLNALGDRLRKDVADVLSRMGIEGHTGSYGSLVEIYLFKEKVEDGKSYAKNYRPIEKVLNLLNLALLNAGLFCIIRGHFLLALSTPMNDATADKIVRRLEEGLGTVAPLLK